MPRRKQDRPKRMKFDEADGDKDDRPVEEEALIEMDNSQKSSSSSTSNSPEPPTVESMKDNGESLPTSPQKWLESSEEPLDFSFKKYTNNNNENIKNHNCKRPRSSEQSNEEISDLDGPIDLSMPQKRSTNLQDILGNENVTSPISVIRHTPHYEGLSSKLQACSEYVPVHYGSLWIPETLTSDSKNSPIKGSQINITSNHDDIIMESDIDSKDMGKLIKEGIPRKLVRGQDVWLCNGAEQTKQILKCMWCGESFRSLDRLTSHMRQTQHYANIISQEQIIAWREAEDKTSPQAHLNAVLTCKVCDQTFSSLKDLSTHMVKLSHYKEHILRSMSDNATKRRYSRDRRRKSLPVRRLLELERGEVTSMDSDSQSVDSDNSELSSKIQCEKCGDKIDTREFVHHVWKCIGANPNNNSVTATSKSNKLHDKQLKEEDSEPCKKEDRKEKQKKEKSIKMDVNIEKVTKEEIKIENHDKNKPEKHSSDEEKIESNIKNDDNNESNLIKLSVEKKYENESPPSPENPNGQSVLNAIEQLIEKSFQGREKRTKNCSTKLNHRDYSRSNSGDKKLLFMNSESPNIGKSFSLSPNSESSSKPVKVSESSITSGLNLSQSMDKIVPNGISCIKPLERVSNTPKNGISESSVLVSYLRGGKEAMDLSLRKIKTEKDSGNLVSGEHPLRELQKLLDKTDAHLKQPSTSAPSLTATPPGYPGAILAFSWACSDALVTNSSMKCAFCNSQFVSRGAFRHHLSKCHFRGRDDISPDKTGWQSSSSSSSTPSKKSPKTELGENPHSKFMKYSQLAKELSGK